MTNPLDAEAIVGYKFVHQLPLPEPTSTALEYLVAENGVFARAIRPGIEVEMPISQHEQSLKGLARVEPHIQVIPLVPEELLIQIWRSSCQACANPNHPLEMLFHLLWVNGQWQLVIPEQTQTVISCQPVETDSHSSAHQATIEIHSHGSMRAFFSDQDNRDESFGFRIFGVLGKVRSIRPEILMRVGLFGHCWNIPAAQVFQLSNDGFMHDLTLHQGSYYYANYR
jgi:PRTRC genetic system protein A